jgi:hypothetical protein
MGRRERQNFEGGLTMIERVKWPGSARPVFISAFLLLGAEPTPGESGTSDSSSVRR